jgi:hypothetical protein
MGKVTFIRNMELEQSKKRKLLKYLRVIIYLRILASRRNIRCKTGTYGPCFFTLQHTEIYRTEGDMKLRRAYCDVRGVVPGVLLKFVAPANALVGALLNLTEALREEVP